MLRVHWLTLRRDEQVKGNDKDDCNGSERIVSVTIETKREEMVASGMYESESLSFY
jgi:hypothetical protein